MSDEPGIQDRDRNFDHLLFSILVFVSLSFAMKIWKCGQFNLPLGGKTYVMGIVNVTDDSFSGDGVHPDTAVVRARQMVEDGADLLDIGGESTRPGARPVPAEEEVRRVVPVIEALAGGVAVPVSVDTSKADVARAALAAGASLVNDISAGTSVPPMLEAQ